MHKGLSEYSLCGWFVFVGVFLLFVCWCSFGFDFFFFLTFQDLSRSDSCETNTKPRAVCLANPLERMSSKSQVQSDQCKIEIKHLNKIISQYLLFWSFEGQWLS